MGEKKDGVRVALKIRPILPLEEEFEQCVKIANSTQIVLGATQTFTFDRVYSANTEQAVFYEECGKELVQNFLAGFNSSVIAYGQTGSGKTYTMGSVCNSFSTVSKDSGLIIRVLSDIFEICSQDCVVEMSYLEVYKETLKDLLTSSTDQEDLKIRTLPNGVIHVQNLKQHRLDSLQDAIELLEIGMVARKTAPTKMNQNSSRSHALITITLRQLSKKLSSKFHLVDLAGSERNKRSGVVGNAFNEAVSINEGLLALGNVISALSQQPQPNHIPYRESKLTRLLQDSLGGNSRTVFIACISPSESDFQETLSTLKYAIRAGCIINKPILNFCTEAADLQASAEDDQVQAEEKELGKLRHLIGYVKLELTRMLEVSGIDAENKLALKRLISSLKCNKISSKENVKEEFNSPKVENTNISEQLATAISEKNKLKDENVELQQEIEALNEHNEMLSKELQTRKSIEIIDQGISCKSLDQRNEDSEEVISELKESLRQSEVRNDSLLKQFERIKFNFKQKTGLQQEDKGSLNCEIFDLQEFIQRCLNKYNESLILKRSFERTEQLRSRIKECERLLENAENLDETQIRFLKEEIEHLKTEEVFKMDLMNSHLNKDAAKSRISNLDEIISVELELKASPEKTFRKLVKEHVQLIIEAKVMQKQNQKLTAELEQERQMVSNFKSSLVRCHQKTSSRNRRQKVIPEICCFSARALDEQSDVEKMPLQPQKIKIARHKLKEIKF